MRRETAAGVTFLATALFFLIFGLQLPLGTPARVGAGFLPVLGGGLLLVLALVILVQDLRSPSGKKVDAVNWRGLAAITGAVVVFGVCLTTLGMVLTTVLSVLVAGLAQKPFRPVETLLVGVTLALASVAIFIWGIGMLIPVWPQF